MILVVYYIVLHYFDESVGTLKNGKRSKNNYTS
ncbi:MAG: hypothetical protein DDT19_02858 [Syntrophomonadaceae bacterium]|nr:hypothetical protein [Bacillota bacterium]